MKKIFYIAFIAIAAFVSGCKDDDDVDSGEINLAVSGLFFTGAEESASTTFSTVNANDVQVVSQPVGWSVAVSGNVVLVYPPDAADADSEQSGDVVLQGRTANGYYASRSLYVARVSGYDFDALGEQANCVVAQSPDTFYTIDPSYKGEQTFATIQGVAGCRLLWSSTYDAVKYVQMTKDGKIGFYTNPDAYDVDADGEKDDLMQANALIAAVDANDNVLWSWHVWVTDSYANIDASESGYLMNANIGAFQNRSETEDDILLSSGMFYQWGRKDPFINAATYNAAGAADATLYLESGSWTYQSYVACDSSTGNLTYSTANPTTFITNTNASGGNWIYSNGGVQDDWWTANNNVKSIYDPSPKGYRVPTQSELAEFFAENLSGQNLNGESYSAYFVNTAKNYSSLYMALGLKTYFDGTIQNLAKDSYYAWSGYFWSSTPVDDSANAVHFWYDENQNPAVGVSTTSTFQRAYGMQIRPIKM